MKVLITGITGMIGIHFSKIMCAQGLTIYGIARNSAASRTLAVPDKNIIYCDILDQNALEDVIREIKPDIVIHLAAQAFNSISWQSEFMTQQTNYIGTANVLKCCLKVVPKAKILLACSSAEYGDFDPEDCPLKEDHALRPISPYGVSKVATENLGYQYYKNYGMKIFLPRMFIHVGTGHPPATAIQNFAKQLAMISQNNLEPIIRVGNLKSARDFIDVRDGVSGMILLLEKGMPGEPVNICSGKSWKISNILNMLIEISGLKVEIKFDKSLHRPSDELLLFGNNSKLIKLGWKQKYSIQETLSTVYDDWVNRLQKHDK